MTNPPVTIKKIVVLVKLSDGTVREILLSELVKKEIYKLIDGYGITVGEDISEFLKIKP